MEIRKLKHRINVLDTWKKMRAERMMKAKIDCHHDSDSKPENSFYRLIKSNDYEYGRDEIVREVFEEVSGIEYTGQFEPDADYFAYVILREWGRLVTVSSYDYTYERNFEEEVDYIAPFIGRFIEVDHELNEKIRNCLLSKAKSETYIEDNSAVVMWWQGTGAK